jgi:hypothetical protein
VLHLHHRQQNSGGSKIDPILLFPCQVLFDFLVYHWQSSLLTFFTVKLSSLKISPWSYKYTLFDVMFTVLRASTVQNYIIAILQSDKCSVQNESVSPRQKTVTGCKKRSYDNYNLRKYYVSTVIRMVFTLASRSEGDIQPDEDTTRKRTKKTIWQLLLAEMRRFKKFNSDRRIIFHALLYYSMNRSNK